MTTTLPGRIHSAAVRAERQRERVREGHHAIPTLLVLGADDVIALDALIRSGCPDETTCSLCGGRICESCSIGDPVACADDPTTLHHSGCQDECDGCVAAIRRARLEVDGYTGDRL